MKKGLWQKITIVLISLLAMGDMVVIPAVGEIFAAFPNANPNLLNFFLTGPMLIAIFASILCGFLARYISKKNLLIAGYVMFIIAACGGALFDNIYYMDVMRAIVGFTYGIVSAASMALIAEVFIAEKERSFMMGAYNSIMAGCGVIMTLVSGFLAVGNWHHSFYVYLVAIPIVIMMIVFLPQTPPEGSKSSGVKEKRDRLPIRKLIPESLSNIIINALYGVTLYFIAVYLIEEKLGDASTAGILTALATVGSFLANMFFSTIYMRLRRATPIVFYLVMSGAYVVMAYPPNIWIVGIMVFLCGASYGLCFTYYFMHPSTYVSESVMSLTMGIMTAGSFFGAFLSTYALDLYKTVFKVDTIAKTLPFVAITLAIGGLLSIILTIRSRKQSISVHTDNA